MSLAVEKLKPASVREQFVRMGFTWVFTNELDGYTVVDNGGLGTWNVYSVPIPVGAEVTEVGIYTLGAEDPFAEVASTSLIDGWNRWAQDSDAGLLYVSLESVPDVTVEPLFVRFRLFFKTGADQRWYGTPTDDESTERLWRGRVSQPLVARQSIADLFAGIFSYGETSFALTDHDGFVHELVDGRWRSVNNREVDVWQRVGDLDASNFVRLFRGRLKAPTLAPLSISFSAYDEFAVLDQSATLGESEDHILVPTTSVPRDVGKPIPTVVGHHSYYDLVSATPAVLLGSAPAHLRVANASPAYVETYAETCEVTENRTWLLYRSWGLATTPMGATFGTLNRVNAAFTNIFFWHFSSISHLAPGQCFAWEKDSVLYYSIVRHVGAFSFDGFDYNLITYSRSGASANTSADPWEEGSGGLALVIKGMAPYDVEPVYGRDFTVDTTQVGEFTRMIKVVFEDDFESNFADSEPLDPAKHTVEWAIDKQVSGSEFRHGTILKSLLEKAGLTVNAASISAANSSFASDAYLMLPERGASEFGSYRAAIEPILRGMVGFLRVNDDEEVEYVIPEAPSTGVETFDDTDHTGIAVDVNYQDIKTFVRFENPALASPYGAPYPYANLRGTTRMLHGTDVEEAIVHAIGPYSYSARTAHVAALKAYPVVTFSFEVLGMRAIDLNIGDDITLEGTRLPGGFTSRDVKVISLEKGTSSVRITALALDALEALEE